MSLASVLSGLGVRLSSMNRATRAPAYAPRNRRSAVAAEISLLEPRCLLSAAGLKAAHSDHAVAHPDQNGGRVDLDFAGYIWNANYRWSQDSGNYSDGQLFSPNQAQLVPGGLQLKLTPTTLDNGTKSTTSADLELVGKVGDSKPFHPGYGQYLVSATGNFNQLASTNGLFGAFTYENLSGIGYFDGNKITRLPNSVIKDLKPGYAVSSTNYLGNSLLPDDTKIDRIASGIVHLDKSSINNPGNYPHSIYFTDNRLKNAHRELDTIEVVRDPNTPGTNAQFTLQPWNALPGPPYPNVNRFSVGDTTQITVWMDWKGPNKPVTFKEYNGLYNMSDLPATPSYEWKTGDKDHPPDQDPFIPDDGLQTYHLILWYAHWLGAAPTTTQTVTVANFQYKP